LGAINIEISTALRIIFEGVGRIRAMRIKFYIICLFKNETIKYFYNAIKIAVYM